jgi:hypothetical protein
MARKTIHVKAGPRIDERRVALWDKDPSHPNGDELFVVADGEIHEATLTDVVVEALNEGRLEEVEGGPG